MQKLDLTKTNSFIAVQEFILYKSFGRFEKLKVPLTLIIVNFLQTKCIFCVPLRLKPCLDGSSFITNSTNSNELNELEHSFMAQASQLVPLAPPPPVLPAPPGKIAYPAQMASMSQLDLLAPPPPALPAPPAKITHPNQKANPEQNPPATLAVTWSSDQTGHACPGC